MMTVSTRTLFPLLLSTLLAVFALAGCAEKRPHPLLLESPEKMSDSGLLQYYYDLESAIAECESHTGDTSVGLGGGSGGGGGFFGVGISKAVDSCDSAPLRQRRTETRLEMERRGLRP